MYKIIIHNESFCESLMFIHFDTHDILIFALNCNKYSLNIKLHVNFICVNGWLSVIQFYFFHINIKFLFQNKV
jgi:hypothetical protein